MALTADQLADMQADLGIAADEAVFTDDQLNRLYARADSDYETAVCYALDQLMMNAARFNDYTAGASTEKKSQVFAQLKAMREMWGKRAGIGYGTIEAGVVDLDFMEKGD
jgi:hypothetical protein